MSFENSSELEKVGNGGGVGGGATGANGQKLKGIVKFDGFDDGYDDLEEDGVLSTGPMTDKKRKRTGKKKNRRQKVLSEIDEYLRAEHIGAQHAPKNSRLLQELHSRERVNGMTRGETRELLQDKLLFLGEFELKSLRLRRFCLIVTSDEQFDLGNGTKIPAEIVSVSMDNGKINSILRFFPTYTKTFEMDAVEMFGKHRMKRVYWNPSIVRDSNLMCRTWCHFLDHSLLHLILVPVSCQRALLSFLRNLNEIRSVLNQRPTVSICLSRVVSCEDFIIAAQNVIATTTAEPIPSRKPTQDSTNYALDVCRYHLQSMSKIFMSATFTGSNNNNNSGGGVRPLTSAPPVAPIYYQQNNNNNFNANSLYSRLAAGNSNEPRFGQNRSYSFLELIDEAPLGYPTDSEKYQRIMHWISDVAATSSDNGTSSVDGKILEEDHEHGEFLKVLLTGKHENNT